MNVDYLILGMFLPSSDLGYYFFGFVLVANVTGLLATGISQTLLPILSRISHDSREVSRQFFRISGAISILAGILCIGLIGLGPLGVHWVWGGKWDGAHFVILCIAAILPVRLLATVARVGLEARGKWLLCATLLMIEALILGVCAWFGAVWGGLQGAAVAVAVQRAFSGLVAFPIFSHLLGVKPRRTLEFILRLLGPYGAAIGLLLLLSPSRHGESYELEVVLHASVETALAMAIFVVGAFVLNKNLLKAMVGLVVARGPR
jgi:PST family polysaccharide transporter